MANLKFYLKSNLWGTIKWISKHLLVQIRFWWKLVCNSQWAWGWSWLVNTQGCSRLQWSHFFSGLLDCSIILSMEGTQFNSVYIYLKVMGVQVLGNKKKKAYSYFYTLSEIELDRDPLYHVNNSDWITM